MNHSGDAAEQIVRLSLEGVEVVARITGAAAKEIATFLVAALKNKNSNLKLKGKARLASMLKSGKALEIFSAKDSDLQKFAQGAKQYGIVYCVLRDKKHDKDGMCDIMVKADDAPKITRIVERFEFATVDKAKIENEIVQAKAEKAQGDQPAPDRADTDDKLLDDFLGTNEGKTAPKKQPEQDAPDASKTTPAKETPVNPAKAKTEKSLPSEPTFKSKSNSAKGTSSRPSVREELQEIKATRQTEKETDTPMLGDWAASNKPRADKTTTHKQPQNNRKPKSKKAKER